MSTAWRITTLLTLGQAWLLPAPVYAGSPSGRNQQPHASGTILRVARSDDGLSFTDTGDLLLFGAAAPDLTVLPNGDVFALFDLAGRVEDRTVLAVARSSDGGRSWSAARPLKFNAGRNRSVSAKHGDAILEQSGQLRLFFTSQVGDGQGNRSATVIRSAVSRNGYDFRLDSRICIRPHGLGDLHPIVGRSGSRIHLFTTTDTDARQHFVSRDGRLFARLTPLDASTSGRDGSIISLGKRMRSYASSQKGIVSLLSSNGRDWSREQGMRLAQGWDPAVARLKDGSYLMVYCANRGNSPEDDLQLVNTEFDPITVDQFDWTTLADEWGDISDEVPSAEKGIAAVDASATGIPHSSSAGADSTMEQNGTGFADWDPIASDGFAPPPNFKHKIDYFEWYKQYALGHPEDNAYDYYMAFMPGPNDEPGSKPVWPDVYHDMFDEDYNGPPIPWDAESHPLWEQTHQSVQHLLDQFREASTHAGYATPAQSSFDENDEEFPEGKKLLIGMMLPSLSSHRRMAKSTLASAWRKVDGKVSSVLMLDAWRTLLRAASHLHQGATIIEDLVGTAIRAQVQKTARWALKHDVFTADELETALDTLREFDHGAAEPAKYIRGEHAMAMDMTQWMFSPPSADGKPKMNAERAAAISAQNWLESVDLEDLTSLGPEDAYASIDAFEGYYRELGDMMRVGYPDVRASDVEAAGARYVQTSPVTQLLLPALSRYFQLSARLETSRRATQLAYATHLFQTRNGRFPESLEELPVDSGNDIRIDPFSGEFFGYQLTDDGPRIYSLSENGVDDGGVHSPRWGDKITNDSGSDDHVFWPPQQ